MATLRAEDIFTSYKECFKLGEVDDSIIQEFDPLTDLINLELRFEGLNADTDKVVAKNSEYYEQEEIKENPQIRAIN